MVHLKNEIRANPSGNSTFDMQHLIFLEVKCPAARIIIPSNLRPELVPVEAQQGRPATAAKGEPDP